MSGGSQRALQPHARPRTRVCGCRAASARVPLRCRGTRLRGCDARCDDACVELVRCRVRRTRVSLQGARAGPPVRPVRLTPSRPLLLRCYPSPRVQLACRRRSARAAPRSASCRRRTAGESSAAAAPACCRPRAPLAAMSKTYTFVSYVEHNLLVEVADIMTVRAARSTGLRCRSGGQRLVRRARRLPRADAPACRRLTAPLAAMRAPHWRCTPRSRAEARARPPVRARRNMWASATLLTRTCRSRASCRCTWRWRRA